MVRQQGFPHILKNIGIESGNTSLQGAQISFLILWGRVPSSRPFFPCPRYEELEDGKIAYLWYWSDISAGDEILVYLDQYRGFLSKRLSIEEYVH